MMMLLCNLNHLLCAFTETDNVRLVGGTSHCSGILDMRHQGEWRPASVDSLLNDDRKLGVTAVVCKQLGCGSLISMDVSSSKRSTSGLLNFKTEPEWKIISSCDGSESSLMECGKTLYNPFGSASSSRVEVICSGNSLSICLCV